MANDECYTPFHIIEMAREVLGSIDFDPASCREANKIVRADWYCYEGDSGLKRDWSGNVWLNPPLSHPLPWIKKLVAYKGPAIALMNNTTETVSGQLFLANARAVCFLLGRLNFTGPGLEGKTSNRYAQMIGLFDPGWSSMESYDRPVRFLDAFSKIGIVTKRA